MELITGDVEHYTPPVEHLRPFKQITCSQPDCSNTFTNQANYEMHLERHHRVIIRGGCHKSFNERLYHCPEQDCIYQYGREKGKHFKNMKYLRQHFQKVHLAKEFGCEDCRKAFTTEAQLRKHQRDVCGRIFACRECGWPYESLEALLTHGKRKGHNVKEIIMINKNKGKVPKTKASKEVPVQEDLPQQPVEEEKSREAEVGHLMHKEMQATAAPPPPLAAQHLCATQMSAGVQTDCFSEMSDSATNQDISNALDEIHSLLRDIETQTEPFLATANENQNYLDQMLAQSSHMYTQTCDDFLSELGLADIQTQTHWPSPQRNHGEEKLQFTTTATSTNPCIHDELLVSTETQTSFTQCLLNSCSDAGTSTPPVSFAGLYHTQHTQTCDPLLESFDFGGQAGDLMDGFQSTYTQT